MKMQTNNDCGFPGCFLTHDCGICKDFKRRSLHIDDEEEGKVEVRAALLLGVTP